jgi:hypothetical protein
MGSTLKQSILFSIIIIIGVSLFSNQSEAAGTEWFISKSQGIRFPLPRKWIKGIFNPISTIKLILFNPDGTRIVMANEKIASGISEKKWIESTLKHLKKKKFKFERKSQIVIMGKPMGFLITAKKVDKKSTVTITLALIIHKKNGFVFTFSCNPRQITIKGQLKKKLCKKRESEFSYMLSRLILF